MRRYAPALIAAASGALLLAPLIAHAAGIPYFGPIIPDLTCNGGSGGSYQISPLAWGALITIVNNIIALALTIAVIFIAPLLIAYAGFLYLTSGASPANRGKANGVLTNTIVGLLVALAAWIIVDAVMAALYNPSAGAGAWYSIITSDGGDPCLEVAGSLNSAPLGSGASTVTGSGPDNGTLYSYGQGAACNAQNIEQQDPGIPSKEANQLACIAQGESTCGTGNNLNSYWNKDTGNGKASTAAGPYQVLLSSHSSCYDNPICEQAAGAPGQPLNCKAAFDKNGFVINQSLADTCANAAKSIGCSAAAAQCALGSDTDADFTSAYKTDKYLSSCLNPPATGG
jgi:hypothetical protein